MNWPLFALMALVLLITVVISITIILFIRHWANRSEKINAQQENEGVYFVRYIPPDKKFLTPAAIKLPRKQGNYRKPAQYLLSIAFGLSMIGLFGSSMYMNRDKLAAPIELSEQELSAIPAKKHQWAYQDFQQLPELWKYLDKFRVEKKGLILIDTPVSKPWPSRSGDLSARGLKHWQAFAMQHKLAVKTCSWKQLKQCQKSRGNWLHIILPGLWESDAIRTLTESGKQVLLYGPPQQVITDNATSFNIAGMTFQGGLTPDSPNLALTGDTELTLGFDAGMVVKARPSFKHFQVESKHPQAISISQQNMAGGEMTTRLYARAYQNAGRLVWMDFSPNPQDHQKAEGYYLDTIVAAIFRYFSGESYSSWSTWPEGKKFAALLEEDTEDQYQNAQQVAAYFHEKNYPITWFILSEEALENRDLTRFLAETGEIACHGDNHMDFPRQPLEIQQQRIARCKKVLQALTGEKVTAFRPPREAHNQHTLSAMYNNGIRHFIAETSTDRFTPIVYGNAENKTALISLPRMNTDDYTLWGKMRASDSTSLIHLKQEADWVKQVGGLFIFSFHTQYMGDAKHLQTIKDIADYIHDSEAYFATSSDIAQWWQLRVQLMSGQPPAEAMMRKYQPVSLRVDARGKLLRERISSPAKIATTDQEKQQ